MAQGHRFGVTLCKSSTQEHNALIPEKCGPGYLPGGMSGINDYSALLVCLFQKGRLTELAI